jgi:hypothetical protein
VITDPAATVALSNLGWVDHGSIWRFDARGGEADIVPVSDAAYLRLHTGSGEHFAVEHHWKGQRFRVSAHAYARPDAELARVEVRGSTAELDGDARVWSTLPPAYVGYLNGDATGAAGYFVVVLEGDRARVESCDWFDDTYDHGYQSVMWVEQLDAAESLLFSVQRSSELVLYDTDARQVRRRVPLAGRHGNPQPILSAKTSTIWVIDYDTLVRLDRRSWTVERAALMQLSDRDARMFVGNAWLPLDESYVLVPRPGSSDVLRVDPTDLSILDRVELGRQPITAAILDNTLVVARDWKSGDLVTGAVGDPQ